MDKDMVSVRYVWHDCFTVVTDRCVMVFDFWKWPVRMYENGDPAALRKFLGPEAAGLPVYVFVSHGHKDHFNPAIFGWTQDWEDVRYIVSNDVYKRIRHVVSPTSVYSGPRVDSSRVIRLLNGETWSDDLVSVQAFPSTDAGNSYAVRTGGLSFFHAGDLNAWIWKDESTEQELRKALGDYRACLDAVERAGFTGFDFAFFPVDSRIGRDYFTGAEMFVRRFDVRRFFPMHFALGDEEERETRRADALRFDLYANRERGEYIALTAPGDSYCSFNC